MAVNRGERTLVPVTASVLLCLAPFLSFLANGGRGLVGLPARDPAVPGDSDVYEHAWHFWWVGSTIGAGGDPRFCPLAGPAPGTALAAQNIGWIDAALFGTAMPDSPSKALSAALAAGTLLCLAGGWAFARSWGLSVAGSAFAACCIVWAPPRTAHLLQHYQIASIGWILLSLALLRCRAAGKSRRGSLFLFVLAGSAAGLESPYHTVLLAAGSAATLALSRPSAKTVLAASTAVLASAAIAWGFYEAFPGPLPDVSEGWRASVYWSAEPASFVMPGPFGLLGRLFSAPLRMPWMPNVFEGVVTPGLGVLLLSATALAMRIRRGMIAAWALLGVLALGPVLKLSGQPVGLLLPYRVLLEVPLLAGARSPSRFAMLAAAFLSIPAASAWQSMRPSARLAAAAVLALELVPPGLPLLPDRVPSVYLSGELEGPVLEVPASPQVRMYAFFQTADGLARPVFPLARSAGGGALPGPFDPASSCRPGIREAGDSGVSAIVYNRWLFDGAMRDSLDEHYGGLFPAYRETDSVWVWRR